MKKTITIIAICMLSAYTSFSQLSWNCGTFYIQCNDTNLVCPTNTSTLLNCTITNVSCCNSINVTQIIGAVNLPAGWSVSMCNPNGCFNNTVTTNTFIIAPSSSVIARFDISAGANAGSGTVSARFEDAAAPTTNGATFTIVANPSATGIASIENSNQLLSQNFPNPFTTTTTFNYNLPSNKGSFQIFDVTGKQISSEILSSSKGTITIGEGLSTGIFFATLKDENGNELATRKIIVQ